MALTAEQRTQRARLAAYARWSRENPCNQARRGQAGLLAKFEREVDPDGVLLPEERQRRARAARKRHMTALAFRSSKARQPAAA